MSMGKHQLLSPLFLKYQAEFEKNPRSRVFAPLAEIYRKLGMHDKAMEILSQGIRVHPTYLMGYLGLAFCYFDLKQYHLAYSTLRPFVETSRDNLRLQKLFSDICLELEQKEEALETLKYLLFINPRDKEVANLVLKIETEVEAKTTPLHKPIIISEKEFENENDTAPQGLNFFDLEKIDNNNKTDSRTNFDDWVTIDLVEEKNVPNINYESWNVNKGDKPHILKLDLDDSKEEGQKFKILSEPIITHTLVDLYCGQGHIEKALEILEKIKELNPDDQKTIDKIEEIKALSGSMAISKEEEDGRRHLMGLIDNEVNPERFNINDQKEEQVRVLGDKLSLFLKKIKKRALDYQSGV